MLVSIRAFTENDVWASGEYGRVRHFDGSEWNLTELETTVTLYAIDGVSSRDLWVGGAGGFLAHFDGGSWQTVSSPTTDDIKRFHVVSSTEIYASAYGGQLLYYNGEKWMVSQSSSRAELTGLTIDQDGIGWFSGHSAVLMSVDMASLHETECINNGDISGDGLMTAGDAQTAFAIALSGYEPTPEEFCAADCNGDGSVTAGDAQGIFIGALGLGTCSDRID